MSKLALALALSLPSVVQDSKPAAAKPVAATTAAAKDVKKETITLFKIFPKPGQETAFKTALAAHVQKYHTGGWSWRVNEVQSGPDQGSYMIVEGPNSWTELDGRGDLGAEHMKDFETNLVGVSDAAKNGPETYMTFNADVSTVAPGAFSTKTLVRHLYVKPGRLPRTMESLKTWKKSWEKRGMNVAVWSSFFSGETEIAVAIRLKQGWKDLDTDMLNAAKAFEEIGGPKAYEAAMDEVAQDIERSVDEMIEFKPELSSKSS
jgi:hypothetical protein